VSVADLGRECADEDAAKMLEAGMKREHLPPLTKR
jgi:hypothetical protein